MRDPVNAPDVSYGDRCLKIITFIKEIV